MKILSLIFNFLLLFNIATAQEEFIKFSQLSNEQGLSSSTVKSIIQDFDGFIWIATLDGLNRYDGFEFKVFRKSSGSANTLTKNDINIVAAGNKGFIWAGSSEGVDRLNTRTEVFEHFKHIENDSTTISYSNVTAIIKDRVLGVVDNNHIWIGTSVGLNRFDPSTKQIFHYFSDIDDEKSISHNSITTLFIAKNNELWVGTKNGLNQYVSESNNFIRHIENDTNEFSINGNDILSITEDKYQNIWISTTSGINIYNRKTKQFSNGNNNPELFFFNFPSVEAKVLLTDNQEQVWMGTEDEGLFRYDYSLESFKNFQEQDLLSNTLASNSINTLFEDKSGIIWVGTNGSGINKLRYSKELHFRHVRKDLNLESTIVDNNIAAIYQDNFNNIWYGTFGKGLSKYSTSSESFSEYEVGGDDTSLSGNTIYDITEDKSGNLWIATDNGLNQYNHSDDVFERIDSEILGGYSVFSLFLDKTNILWIGTDNGISKYNYNSKTYEKYLHDLNNENSISDNYVISFAEDDEGKFVDRYYKWVK